VWRATIRFSLNDDTNSKTRGRVVACLKPAGFRNVDTGTWEAFSRDSGGVTSALSAALAVIERSGLLDHYWVHVEKLSTRQQTSLLRGARLVQVAPKPNPRLRSA
jgi:hypothetical protein